ncbi:hypothetical protein BDK51DRAFT_40538 [Blyttiomyces helicus]|uniref:Regulatory subunit Dfp1/Him1 central region domain-containing protein n=1 Tax=Blyttiomyces helicus TaxID=388810 RepID=A0A4P9WJB7_9FUNG|nr:hypothetical protein BDK51DRAFT_40538 [Blyttiomyces helicus]|eukprot:RKO90706.1 hypothetical protein BDK51DRAFT_40538 [Blyttiomyces helicus]
MSRKPAQSNMDTQRRRATTAGKPPLVPTRSGTAAVRAAAVAASRIARSSAAAHAPDENHAPRRPTLPAGAAKGKEKRVPIEPSPAATRPETRQPAPRRTVAPQAAAGRKADAPTGRSPIPPAKAPPSGLKQTQPAPKTPAMDAEARRKNEETAEKLKLLFKNEVFYFASGVTGSWGKQSENRRDLLKIKSDLNGGKDMKAHISMFYDKNITYYIIPDCGASGSVEERGAIARVKATLSSHIVVKTESWLLERMQYVKRRTGKVAPPKSRPLMHMVEEEKILGIPTTRDDSKLRATRRSKGAYVRVTNTADNKSVLYREFPKVSTEEATWPQLFLGERRGRCPFYRPYSSEIAAAAQEEAKGATSVGDQQQTPGREDLSHPAGAGGNTIGIASATTVVFKPGSAASGLVSGSVATRIAQSRVQNSQIEKLGQRAVFPIKPKSQVAKPARKDPPQKKEAKTRYRAAGKTFYNKAGYCENCRITYDQFIEVYDAARIGRESAQGLASESD